MELRPAGSGRWVYVATIAEELNERRVNCTEGDECGFNKLESERRAATYLSKIDHHCMPGSYHDELVPVMWTGAAQL